MSKFFLEHWLWGKPKKIMQMLGDRFLAIPEITTLRISVVAARLHCAGYM